MLRIFHIFSFVVLVNGFLTAQFSSDSYDLDIDSIDAISHYNKIISWNKKDLQFNKNLPTHQLDSIIGFFVIEHPMENKSKTQFIYEKSRDISVSWDWDLDTQNWIPHAYNVFHFDKDLLVAQSYNFWTGDINDLNEQTPSVTRKYIYNENNQLIEYQSQNALAIQENRLNNNRFYYYDSLGLPSKASFLLWSSNSDSLELIREITYGHNQDGLLEYSETKDFDQTLGTYTGHIVRMTYNNQKKIESEKWHGGLSNPPNSPPYRIWNYYYNEDGNLSLIIDGLVDNFPAEIEFVYHPYGSLMQEKSYASNHDVFDPIWFGYGRSVYTHDENITVDKVRFQRTRHSNSFFDYSHLCEKHMLLRETHFVNGGSLGSGGSPESIERRSDYFYSEIKTSSSEDQALSEVTNHFIFPNPTSGLINLDNKYLSGQYNLTLFNINGTNVLEQIVLPGQELNLSSLADGLYFYRFNKADQQHVGKLLIER